MFSVCTRCPTVPVGGGGGGGLPVVLNFVTRCHTVPGGTEFWSSELLEFLGGSRVWSSWGDPTSGVLNFWSSCSGAKVQISTGVPPPPKNFFFFFLHFWKLFLNKFLGVLFLGCSFF